MGSTWINDSRIWIFAWMVLWLAFLSNNTTVLAGAPENTMIQEIDYQESPQTFYGKGSIALNGSYINKIYITFKQPVPELRINLYVNDEIVATQKILSLPGTSVLITGLQVPLGPVKATRVEFVPTVSGSTIQISLIRTYLTNDYEIAQFKGTYSFGRVALSWIRFETATSYKLYRDGVEVATIPAGNTTYDDYYNVPGQHTYKLEAITSQFGNVSSAEIKVTIPLAAPTGLTAEIEEGQVRLRWNAVDGALTYRIYRDGSLIATVGQTTYLDSNVIAGTTYVYRVQGYHSELDAEYSEVSILVTSPSLPVPQAPIGLVANVLENDVQLSWIGSPDATSYEVYRGTKLIGTTTETEFRDVDVPYGTYVYIVYSLNHDVRSSPSTVTATVFREPSAPRIWFTSVDPPAISWLIETGVQQIKIFKDHSLVATVDPKTQRNWTDNNVNSQVAEYYVTVVRDGLESQPSNILLWQEGMSMEMPTLDGALTEVTGGVVDMIAGLLGKFSSVLVPAAIVLIAAVSGFFWFIQRTKKAMKSAN